MTHLISFLLPMPPDVAVADEREVRLPVKSAAN